MEMTPERWQKIERLYHATLEREESQRSAYLCEVCVGDEQLLQEVESLLAQENRAEEFLERPAMEVAAKVLAENQSQISLLGRQLGSYKIASLLGAGGMGEVYQARDSKLSRDVAIKVPAQIAEALEAAHEKGVIHRDLKLANVKVTPEGRVKVLDFGLAKVFAGNSGLHLSNAPTLTAMGTEEGRILGTPTYMSPEQARGKPVDKRTDIWAFGCVFYELLSGQRAFQADTVSDTLV